MNERSRLRTLAAYDILDTPPEQAYDDIALIAAQICGVPVGMVNFVDDRRLFAKAGYGVERGEPVPREETVCTHLVATGELLVVDDLASDPRFAELPAVTAADGFRFYAGTPLTAPDGHNLGAVCALDDRPHTLGPDQRAALEALGRRAVAQLELRRLTRELHHQTVTDPLTGLGNRRALAYALERALATATESAPVYLLVLDLDGFKRYNDTFGHGAGDQLLARRLDAIEGATAFRMGGDEFCVLVAGDATSAHAAQDAAVEALSERGEGFVISCSHGVVEMPREATSAERALQRADERMYDRKNERPTGARDQARRLLVKLVKEREPDLGAHRRDVARLARAVGAELGLGPDALDEVAWAAELHDLGKVAIPDEILSQPTELDSDEWSFMRQHTVLGERILAAAPGLERVGAVVRSSRERWDGAGYPDGLVGDAIPLASRIVFVCDSFTAMTSEPVRALTPGRAGRARALRGLAVRPARGRRVRPRR